MNVFQASSASVDVFPLFLGKAHDLEIDDDDLVIALPSVLEEQRQTGPTVSIQHKLTGISAQSSGTPFTSSHYILSSLN